MEKHVRFRGCIIRFKGEREGSKNKATFPPCNFRRYRGCNGSENYAFDTFVTNLDLLERRTAARSDTARAVFLLFPPPSPVIYNQKTSIPRRVESLINPLSLIYQTRCKLFFFSFHQEREKARKTFHLATHFPSLDTLSFAWAKETINYRHCSRFLSSRGSNPILLESRDELV